MTQPSPNSKADLSQKTHPHLSEADLADIHKQLLGFAQSQLADKALAEDAVQETLIKTMTHHHTFAGKSAYKSWVFTILRNTIIDMLRKNSKLVSASTLQSNTDSDNEALFDVLFDQHGHWQKDQRPTKWDEPDQCFEQDEFWLILESCLTHLPAEQGRVFMMREYVGLDTKEICAECDITSSKFYVLMHRARLRLQSCLSINWYEQTA